MNPARRLAPVLAFVATLAAALAFGAAVSAQSPPSGTALVDARLGWQSTGLTVQAGTPLRFVVTSGLWTYWLGGSPMQPGTGDDYICAQIMPPDTCIEPMPFERKGALIGRVGTRLFGVGQARDYVAEESGLIELRMNDPDSALHDNAGVLTVAINPGTGIPSATATAFTCPPGHVCVTWTPTPIPTTAVPASPTPSATATPTPSASPWPATPTPVPEPSPTPTLVPEPPPCVPATRPLDTVLVLDRSSSMAAAGKLDAARAAIQGYVDAAAVPPGRVALVTFAGVAGINQALTTDPDRIRSALQAVEVGAGTRIDLGLRVAREALDAPDGAAGGAAVIVLLTDGVQNGEPPASVLVEADRAKAAGVILITIGLGADVDADLLRLAASDPTHYFFAPSAADLAAIYRRVAVTIPCSALGGTVFVDRDADGRYDPAVDVPLPDVTVRLAGPVSRVTRSGFGAAPNYHFGDLPIGRYSLQVEASTLPQGLAPSTGQPLVVDLGATPRQDLDLGFARLPVTPTTPSATDVPPVPGTPGTASPPPHPTPSPSPTKVDDGAFAVYFPWAGS